MGVVLCINWQKYDAQRFNPGDNLHMNDAGYQAMAGAIDLSLFRK